MCVSAWVCTFMQVIHLSPSISGWVRDIVFYLLIRVRESTHICTYVCMWEGWIRRAVLVLLSMATVIGWLAAWTTGFQPGHLTWALTLIAHCSSEGGDNEFKTSGSHRVHGTTRPAWPSRRCVCVFVYCWFLFFMHMHLVKWCTDRE